MKKLIESQNKAFGFYGTMQSNYMISDARAAELFDFAAKQIAKNYEISLDQAREKLDDRWGRHFADFLSFHGGKQDLFVYHWKRILRKTIELRGF